MPYRDPEQQKIAKRAYRESDHGRDTIRAHRTLYKHTPTNIAVQKKWRTVHTLDSHHFRGTDGEGWTDRRKPYRMMQTRTMGEVPLYTHHYMMLIAGDRYLYTGQPLDTLDCLEFLTGLNVEKNLYNVSFFFDYDVTMILRSLARTEPGLVRQLFEPRLPGAMVWWNGYGIDYRPKKHLSVKRWTEDNSSKRITIHDVQGFFQSSFVDALRKFGVGTEEEVARVAAMKDKRATFSTKDAQEVLNYSLEECRLMARLADELREHSHTAGVNAEPYEGPGPMAGRALSGWYGKVHQRGVIENTNTAVYEFARKSYYGGRFEVSAHGPIPFTVMEFDLKSAYPYAMTMLPCFEHGQWTTKRTERSTVGIMKVRWNSHPPTNEGDYIVPHTPPGEQPVILPFGHMYPFPVRNKSGRIYYPQSGTGWYWAHEVEVAQRDKYNNVRVLQSRWFNPECTHQPFQWVRDLFDRRGTLEATRPGSGIAIKLLINTLYGKTAQQKPVPGPFLNFLHASFITSTTRTTIGDAIQRLPRQSVVMVATDAIFVRADRINPNVIGVTHDVLGGWEHANTFDDLTIFQPGVYFDGRQAKFKTRGVPKKFIAENVDRLIANSTDWEASVDLVIESHLGLRLALSRGTPTAMADLGNWIPIEKSITSAPVMKRAIPPGLSGPWSCPPLNVNPQGVTHVFKPGDDNPAEQERLIADIESDGHYEGDFIPET